MSKANGDIRIGVYVCHCGTNIAAVVDVKSLAAYGATLPNVVVSREYKYLCSDPGQDLIRQDIAERKLNRVVVASCSPHLHEQTFRNALATGGLNPFFLQMVNIREQDSWVTEDKKAATRKAQDLVRAAARRVAWNESLERGRIPIHPAVMVVGGGIAGIHSALTLANA
ncbi:MAG: disulfide reductase, partial [Bryobacteraceae bacterium]